MTNKLIEIAKKEGETKITREHVELVLAFLKGVITVRGAAKAMKLKSPGQVTHRVPHILRVGLEKGWLKIELPPPPK